MRRLIVILALGAVTAVSIIVLAEATQNRPDTVVANSVGTVTFRVETKRFSESTDAGVALWAACQAASGAETMGIEAFDDDVYVATVSPALGKHAERRIRGCLHDGTLERVRGSVIDVKIIAASRDEIPDTTTGHEVGTANRNGR